MKKALRKMLSVMLALCLWVAPMSSPAFAEEGDVCEISGTTYATLGARWRRSRTGRPSSC